jgi:hypothetical protein
MSFAERACALESACSHCVTDSSEPDDRIQGHRSAIDLGYGIQASTQQILGRYSAACVLCMVMACQSLGTPHLTMDTFRDCFTSRQIIRSWYPGFRYIANGKEDREPEWQ